MGDQERDRQLPVQFKQLARPAGARGRRSWLAGVPGGVCGVVCIADSQRWQC